jgi:hypothetical protein
MSQKAHNSVRFILPAIKVSLPVTLSVTGKGPRQAFIFRVTDVFPNERNRSSIRSAARYINRAVCGKSVKVLHAKTSRFDKLVAAIN